MRHPFQCLSACAPVDSQSKSILLAAAGPFIHSYSLEDGTLLNTWPELQAQESHLSSPDGQGETEGIKTGNISPPRSPEQGNNEPAQKKRKITHRSDSMKDGSGTERSKGAKGGNDPLPKSLPDVIRLVTSGNSGYVVAVTGQDKCIRVFSLQSSGHLQLLSERCMPKRPSMVTITADQRTLLCADKFGDVYSLPLLIIPPEKALPVPPPEAKQLPDVPKGAFVPAASHLTVHTARNRRTLQEQLKRTNQPSEKNDPTFEHDLLLGHVSMLTDIAHVTVEEGTGAQQGKRRSYILTSDRDEHIRVSRGQPQAHIIETYCLGHTEFISRLCVPSWRPSTLISGGGDRHLIVWDWLRGQALQSVELGTHVQSAIAYNDRIQTSLGKSDPLENYVEGSAAENQESTPVIASLKASEASHEVAQVAVSGIWALPSPSSQSSQNDDKSKAANNKDGHVIVACEGLPSLFTFHLNSSGKLSYRQTITLTGNALDITPDKTAANSIIVSIDTVHIPGSTRELRSNNNIQNQPVPQNPLYRFSWTEESGRWVEEGNVATKSSIVVRGDLEMTDVQMKALPDLLYGVGNLRKRGNYED